METNQAIAALTALGHGTRLAAFRLLVEAGPDGRMAGEIAESLAVPNATLSFHLKDCLLYTSPSPRDGLLSRMPSSA